MAVAAKGRQRQINPELKGIRQSVGEFGRQSETVARQLRSRVIDHRLPRRHKARMQVKSEFSAPIHFVHVNLDFLRRSVCPRRC